MIHGIALLGDESGGLHSFPLLSLFFFEWSTGFSELYLTKQISCYFRWTFVPVLFNSQDAWVVMLFRRLTSCQMSDDIMSNRQENGIAADYLLPTCHVLGTLLSPKRVAYWDR
jgi:hypothetical protein